MSCATTLGYDQAIGIPTDTPPPPRRPSRQETNPVVSRYDPLPQRSFGVWFLRLADLASAVHANEDESPSEFSARWARQVLAELEEANLVPSQILRSAEGGVGICFARGNNYADIECLNSGFILGVISNRHDRPTAWEIEPSESAIARAVVRIRKFLEG